VKIDGEGAITLAFDGPMASPLQFLESAEPKPATKSAAQEERDILFASADDD
jgi:hypothetical protein